MNASADWQVPLTSPRCGFMQSEMLPHVALGQNCLMSAAHCSAVQMAFDRIVEHPTESSPTCACMQAIMRPWPGAMPAHKDWTSVVQSRSEVNNPSCALAPHELININPAPSATANNDFIMVALPSIRHMGPRSR